MIVAPDDVFFAADIRMRQQRQQHFGGIEIGVRSQNVIVWSVPVGF